MSGEQKRGLLSRLKEIFAPAPSGPAPAPIAPAAPDDTPLPTWAGVIGTHERYERFEKTVRAYFKSRGKTVMISDGVVTTPRDPSERYGLANILQICAAQPEAAWPEAVGNFFGAMERSRSEYESIRDDADGYEKVADQLFIRLWEAEELPMRDKTVSRELLPGLVGVISIDLPDTVMSLSKTQAEAWGRTHDELFERAMMNLGGLRPESVDELDLPDAESIRVLSGPSFFTASLALRLGDFPSAVGAHGALVAVPTRNVVLAVPIQGMNALKSVAQLISIVNGMYKDGPGSVSKRLFWIHAGNWVEIPYELSDTALNVVPPDEFVRMLETLSNEGGGASTDGGGDEPEDQP